MLVLQSACGLDGPHYVGSKAGAKVLRHTGGGARTTTSTWDFAINSRGYGGLFVIGWIITYDKLKPRCRAVREELLTAIHYVLYDISDCAPRPRGFISRPSH